MVQMERESDGSAPCVSNPGYSGTPLWKIQQQVQEARQRAQQQAQQQALNEPAALEVTSFVEEKAPPLLAHGVCLGGTHLAQGKPVVRHVLVKDLRKAAKHSKFTLPAQGLFGEGAPLGLFALFDGQSCAGEVGPQAAEYCARQFHGKLLRNLSALPPDRVNETFVKAALVKSFDDLDQDFLSKQDIFDGCGASVCLTVGQKIFTAVIGVCDAVLAEVSHADLKNKKPPPPAAISLGSKQGRCGLPDEQKIVQDRGGKILEHEGKPYISNEDGTLTSMVTRALGNIAWKALPDKSMKPIIRYNPEVTCMDLSWGERHPFLLLVGSPVAGSLETKELIRMAAEYPLRPKAASGEIAVKAMELTGNSSGQTAQCTVCVIGFLPPTWKSPDELDKGPAAKKQKMDPTTTRSVRLRHILVKHKESTNPVDRDKKPVTRTKADAEVLLRKALRELREAGEDVGDAAKPEKITPKFQKICREISECPTSQKGGGMCGDLGWLTKDQLNAMGQSFVDTVTSLRLAYVSDITESHHGLHILLRMF